MLPNGRFFFYGLIGLFYSIGYCGAEGSHEFRGGGNSRKVNIGRIVHHPGEEVDKNQDEKAHRGVFDPIIVFSKMEQGELN